MLTELLCSITAVVSEGLAVGRKCRKKEVRDTDGSGKPGQSEQRVKSIHVMGSPLHQAW